MDRAQYVWVQETVEMQTGPLGANAIAERCALLDRVGAEVFAIFPTPSGASSPPSVTIIGRRRRESTTRVG